MIIMKIYVSNSMYEMSELGHCLTYYNGIMYNKGK